MKIISLANIEAKKYQYIPFDSKFTEAFGDREKGGIWMIYGKSGQGKTRFVLDLAKEFDEIGMKVLFGSFEMGICKDFKQEIRNAGIKKEIHSIIFTESFSCEELDDMLSKQRSPDVVIIDSIQYFANQYDATAEKIIELRKKYRKKIFVFVSHVEGKEVEGKTAYAIKRDSFVRILVEGHRAIYIGRGKGGPTGYYTIWDKKAEEYWLQNNNNKDENTKITGDRCTEASAASH